MLIYFSCKLFLKRFFFGTQSYRTHIFFAGLFDPLMGPEQVLPVRIRVDLGVMKMKGYSQDLEPHHQMQYNAISRTPLFRIRVRLNSLERKRSAYFFNSASFFSKLLLFLLFSLSSFNYFPQIFKSTNRRCLEYTDAPSPPQKTGCPRYDPKEHLIVGL